MNEELGRRYRDIAIAYLEHESEAELYEISVLSKRFIELDMGPEEPLQLHLEILDEILTRYPMSEHREIQRRLSSFLLETIMVYSQRHQEIRSVLRELQKKYEELDEAKSSLEKSQKELKEKTAQFIQTAKMTALGEMAAGVAHEINQPLNAINIICTDLFRTGKSSQIDQAYLTDGLREVIDEVRKMAEIVDHMRVFTRRTEGDVKETFDANVPVQGVFKLLGQQLKIYGIEVTKDLRGGLSVTADPVKLEQVVMNLVANARDAVKTNGKQRGMKIGIKTYLAKDEAGQEDFVVYEVCDNGMGIADDIKEKIFEPFFTKKGPGEGTGLGLSVTSQIVKEHEGRVTVESREGQGATFKVFIPASRDRA